MLNLNDVYAEGDIKKEQILEVCSDNDIFRHYIGEYSKSMKSPLRKDSVPSFSVYHSRRYNKLLFKDHATGQFGDCFDIVQLIFGISLREACIMINLDLNLGLHYPLAECKVLPIQYSIEPVELPESRQLGVKFRHWSFCDHLYWTVKYSLEETHLKYYKVFPVELVFLGEDIIWRHTPSNPIYAYLFYKDGKYTYKVYRPLSQDKQWKWLSSTNRTVLQGWDQLPKIGDTLVLTKSLKDVMVYRTLQLPALACQSETAIIKDTVMDELKSRFKRIVINQDNDPAGRAGTEALASAFNLPYYYLTDAKDISDYREWHTRENSFELIRNNLRNIWPGIY